VRIYDYQVPQAIMWQMWAPRTRWDLYRPLRRYWGVKRAGGWAFNPVYDGRGIIGSNIVTGARQ